MNYVQRPAHKE